MSHQRTIGFAVKALANQIKRAMDSMLGDDFESLTGMHFGVIRLVSGAPPEQDLFQRDIEEHFNIRRSTATGILQLMEKNGLIRREPVEYDARLKKIVLTGKAERTCRRLHDLSHELEARASKGLTQEELDTFFRVLEKISHNLE